MNSLMKGIESSIKKAVEEFSNLIIAKHDDIDSDELEELWNDVSKNMKISVTFGKSEKPEKKETKTKSKASSSSSSTDEGCPHAFLKGEKKDQKCGIKPKDGKTYCTRHAKYEDSSPKDKKTVPDMKKSISTPVKKSTPDLNSKRVLRKHKEIDKLWHQESGLVFRSAKERVVIGKCVDNKLLDLSEQDVDECRRWGFSYDEKNVKKVEEKEEEDEEIEEVKPVQKITPVKEEKAVVKEEKQIQPIVETGPKYGRTVNMAADSSSALGKKLWTGSVKENIYTTVQGKLGKEGETKTKTFPTNIDAIKELEKAVKEKLEKGYRIETESSSESTTSSGNMNENTMSDDDDDDDSDIGNMIKGLKNSSMHDNRAFIKNALGLAGITNSDKYRQVVEVTDEGDEEELTEE